MLIVLLLSDHHNSAFNMAFPICFHTFVSWLALFVIIMVGDRYLSCRENCHAIISVAIKEFTVDCAAENNANKYKFKSRLQSKPDADSKEGEQK